MATFNIVCDGPGPHVPASGILGTSSVPNQKGMRCTSPACEMPIPNGALLRDKAAAALTTNATFLALATPTNLAQNAAQVRALTRECNALIRLLLGALDDVSGT